MPPEQEPTFRQAVVEPTLTVGAAVGVFASGTAAVCGTGEFIYQGLYGHPEAQDSWGATVVAVGVVALGCAAVLRQNGRSAFVVDRLRRVRRALGRHFDT